MPFVLPRSPIRSSETECPSCKDDTVHPRAFQSGQLRPSPEKSAAMKMASTPTENKPFTARYGAAPIFMLGGAPRAHEVLSECGNCQILSLRESRLSGPGKSLSLHVRVAQGTRSGFVIESAQQGRSKWKFRPNGGSHNEYHGEVRFTR